MLFTLKNKKGFTLIELLVVVAIIGVLASVVLASLSTARAKSRNARRNSDINQLMIAFNMGLSGGSMPLYTGICISSTCYGGWSGYAANSTVDAYFTPYMPSKPTDPSDSKRGVGGYLYYNTWNGTSSYDGYVFSSGAYLDWAVEPPVTSNSCGRGHIFSSGSAYIECLLKID